MSTWCCDLSSSHASSSEYKTLRQVTRDRLLQEMIGLAKPKWKVLRSVKSTWKVLIVDKITVKVMSCSCKMSDVTNEGVALVEDLDKSRQPFPQWDAIYFIQPLRENVDKVLSDMSGKTSLYRMAYVFFSSPVPKELFNLIKSNTRVRPRIGALCEMNLEYLAVDRQGFITDNERALEELYGENMQKHQACLNVMATRIATVFASMGELPFVRYPAAKIDASTITTMRDLVPTKLAAAVWNQLTEYKNSLKHFPQTETCELLILDRSVDLISPVIHEWTYDAMCHDLLNMDGNKYGQPDKKEVLLEDHDPVWLELRHAHIGDACERLDKKMKTFVSKNKAAQIRHGSRNGGALRIQDMQQAVLALQGYSEQMDTLSLHIGIAEKIHRIARETGLADLAKLEQDLVFGDAGRREVKKFLRTKLDATRENKLRLLMIHSVAYPEDFEGEKGLKLMQLAGLSHGDMNAVYNMRLFDSSCATEKNSTGIFSLRLGSQKKRTIRKERNGEEQTWANSRFYPKIEELIEKLNKGELPENEYACMNDPNQSVNGTAAHSVRPRRRGTWAHPCKSENGSSGSRRMGKRIFVFIIGGATRAELRSATSSVKNFRGRLFLVHLVLMILHNL